MSHREIGNPSDLLGEESDIYILPKQHKLLGALCSSCLLREGELKF